MIVLRMPTVDGPDWWIVAHRLVLDTERKRRIRPIHLLTLLGQTLVGNKEPMYAYCMALENKLFAVRHLSVEYRRAWSSFGDFGDPLYPAHYVRSYEADQLIIASLEAYLAAIYSALEIVALINTILHPNLPRGFRKQAKKFPVFAFASNPWLSRFFDIRSELAHHGTPLVIPSQGKFLIQFRTPKDLLTFKKGRHDITLTEFLEYDQRLFELLDAWALVELGRVDPDHEVDGIVEGQFGKPLKVRKIKARRILRLTAQPRRRRKGGN